ncbi:hypothetical protein PCASD_10855 [Puccinia coronata f. sp. avenae]|uniref:Uncharacterized protein n=1 Tax=Puccinia coronata f. sp. avenae TaxID=200324 RepID=A0A2N5UU69_9BASI|nr:hypothetical protein PCASD_10855 [Puccinia coronata f. sp. avenae]
MSACIALNPLLGTVDEDNDFIDFPPSPTAAHNQNIIAESQNEGIVAQKKRQKTTKRKRTLSSVELGIMSPKILLSELIKTAMIFGNGLQSVTQRHIPTHLNP